MGRPGEYSGALRGGCVDLHSRCAKDRKVTLGAKLLHQFPKGSPQREIGLELLKSGVLQLEDGATQLLKLVRLRLGKDLQQDVSEHYKRFLHRSARLYQQSMQHYIAEESNLHERALQAVKSVTTSSKTETETEDRFKGKGDHCRRFARTSSVGKRGTHWFRTGVCFWRCWKKLRVQSHCKRVERNLGQRRTSQEPTKSNLRDTSTSSSSSRKEVLVPSCPLCSKSMIRRQNRVNKGSFWGCQQWPMCNGTRRPWERDKDETSPA